MLAGHAKPLQFPYSCVLYLVWPWLAPIFTLGQPTPTASPHMAFTIPAAAGHIHVMKGRPPAHHTAPAC